jgi:hypothetical protein
LIPANKPDELTTADVARISTSSYSSGSIGRSSFSGTALGMTEDDRILTLTGLAVRFTRAMIQLRMMITAVSEQETQKAQGILDENMDTIEEIQAEIDRLLKDLEGHGGT